MSITIFCMLLMLGFWAMYSPTRAVASPARLSPRPAPRMDPRPPQHKAPAAPLEWTGMPVPVDRTPRAAALVAPAAKTNGLRDKLRDRYIAARFPGVARVAADLEKSEHVIKAARLYFEEEKYDRALELLDMAIVQCPAEDSMALARLELAFLTRSTQRFLAIAGDFRRLRPRDERWAEISRLGRALLPSEPLFALPGDAPEGTSYGPWPDMPNWIQASWDLTSEVRSAEFHHAMARQAGAGTTLPSAI